MEPIQENRVASGGNGIKSKKKKKQTETNAVEKERLCHHAWRVMKKVMEAQRCRDRKREVVYVGAWFLERAGTRDG